MVVLYIVLCSTHSVLNCGGALTKKQMYEATENFVGLCERRTDPGFYYNYSSSTTTYYCTVL